MLKSLALAAAAFAGGMVAARAAGAVRSDGDASYEKLAVFARVFHHVETSYVTPVEPSRLVYGAIRGMIGTLDKHSTFLEPAEVEALRREAMKGSLPIELERRGEGVFVASVEAGSAAARASVKAGDQLLRVDETPAAKIADLSRAFEGKVGTAVALELERGPAGTRENVELIRETRKPPPVSSKRLEGGVAYVRLRAFSDGVSDEVERALSRAKGSDPKLGGLILDLRDNPGGLVQEAVRLADLWLEKGVIVTIEARGREPEVEEAKPLHTQSGYPIVVLVNERSASASEVLAAALQEHRRAQVLGSQTYGKASVQTVIELEDQSALKLTIARYYTPTGRSLEGTGITPDFAVPTGTGKGRDDALDAAVEFLRAQASSGAAPRLYRP